MCVWWCQENGAYIYLPSLPGDILIQINVIHTVTNNCSKYLSFVWCLQGFRPKFCKYFLFLPWPVYCILFYFPVIRHFFSSNVLSFPCFYRINQLQACAFAALLLCSFCTVSSNSSFLFVYWNFTFPSFCHFLLFFSLFYRIPAIILSVFHETCHAWHLESLLFDGAISF